MISPTHQSVLPKFLAPVMFSMSEQHYTMLLLKQAF